MSRRPTALVIGGTGPTGPRVVEGLHARGYAVTILHSGQHEVEFAVPGVEHLHEDPHFAESLVRGLGSRTFDLVVAQYGRLRVIAEVLVGKAGRVVAVGGATGLYAAEADERWGRLGRPQLFPDTVDLFRRDEGAGGMDKLNYRMVQAMERLFELHEGATYVGYPLNYGPRNPGPYDWAIIRRALDRRPFVVIADGGLKIDARVFTENAADALLRVVDHPDIAAGKRYSVTDERSYSMRQRIEFILRHLGHEAELVDLPYELAWPCHAYWRHVRGHRMAQSTLVRAELGYEDTVASDVALERTVEWLVAHPPAPGGEPDRQVGDPFDYEREDELVRRWRRTLDALGEVEHQLAPPGHQYRHPKEPGEAWTGSDGRRD